MHELCRRIRERWILYDTLLEEKAEQAKKPAKRKPR
jgi:hypothetical protein